MKVAKKTSSGELWCITANGLLPLVMVKCWAGITVGISPYPIIQLSFRLRRVLVTDGILLLMNTFHINNIICVQDQDMIQDVN